MNWVEKSPEGQKLHYYFDMILLLCPFQYLKYVEINIAQFAVQDDLLVDIEPLEVVG